MTHTVYQSHEPFRRELKKRGWTHDPEEANRLHRDYQGRWEGDDPRMATMDDGTSLLKLRVFHDVRTDEISMDGMPAVGQTLDTKLGTILNGCRVIFSYTEGMNNPIADWRLNVVAFPL